MRGITRVKKHQLGIRREVKCCKKIHTDVKLLPKESYANAAKEEISKIRLHEDRLEDN